MVFDDKLSEEGAFGVEKGKRTKLSVGAYVNCQWSQNITKDGMLKYKGIVQSFCDYKSVPNINWESWFEFKVFKMFSLNLYVKFIYDDKVVVNKDIIDENGNEKSVPSGSHFQIKESLGFGISYDFRNKSKPTYTIIK